MMAVGMYLRALLHVFVLLPPVAPSYPVLNRALPNLVIKNLYSINFTIPSDTFIDNEDGNTRNLNLVFYRSNGQPVDKTNWVLLQSQSLLGYITKKIFEDQGSNGYNYILAAVDKNGHERGANVNIKIASLAAEPHYRRRIKMYSLNSLMIYQYGDVQILFVFQNRIASYLKVGRSSLITTDLTVTRSSSQVNINLGWSIDTLTGSECKVSNIIKLRSKLEEAASESVRSLLSPLFVVTEQSESFTDSCSYLSSSPPVIGYQIPPLQVQVGQYFKYNIPIGTYKSPPGSTMRVYLELQYSNGTKVDSKYWLQLEGKYVDEGVLSISGFPFLSSVMGMGSFKLRLAAFTPILVSTYQTIDLQFTSTLTQINFLVTLVHFGPFSASYSSFFTKFTSFMTTHLSVSSSSVLVVKFKSSSQSVSLQFTLRGFSESLCNLSELDRITKQMMTTSGSLSPTFQNGLQSATGFIPSNIEVSYSGSCDPPKILLPLGTLNVNYGGKLEKIISTQAYKDTKDGYALRLSLLSDSGQLVPSYSWVTLDLSKRKIVVIPIDQQVHDLTVFTFKIRLTNSGNVSVDDTFQVRFLGTRPKWSVRFSIKLNYTFTSQSLPNILSPFISKLATFSAGHNQSSIFIHKVNWYNAGQLLILWQNTSLAFSPCDFKGRFAMQRSLQKTPGRVSLPSFTLQAKMGPEFHVSEISFEEAGPCIGTEPKAPYFNFEYIASSFTIDIEPNQVSEYKIKYDFFKDEEDVDLRYMNLQLLDSNGKSVLPKSYWIGLQQSPLRVICVPTDKAYLDSPSTMVTKVTLRVTDSNGKEAETTLNRKLLKSPSDSSYNISMEMAVFQIAHEAVPVQLLYLKEKLNSLLNNITSIYIRSYELISTIGANGKSRLVWSPMRIAEKCDFGLIKRIQSALFQPGTKLFLTSINKHLGSYFQLVHVTDSLSGPCMLNPPVINTLLPTFKVPYCGTFSYQIPRDSYYDKEDGDTRNLKIMFLKTDGTPIPSDHWIQFNESKSSQTFYGIPVGEQTSSIFVRQVQYLLVAQDASGLTVNQTIQIEIIGNLPNMSYSIEMETSPEDGNFFFYRLARKVMTYMNDDSNTFFASSYQKAVNGKYVFVWSNCSLRYDPCDVNAIVKIRASLRNEDGSWKTSFINSLLPEFKEPFLVEKLTGPCKTDNRPRVIRPLSPVVVTSCQTRQFVIPENTFKDDEQGTTRSLSLDLTHTNGAAISKDFWVKFNSTSQTVSIVASDSAASLLKDGQLSLTLSAKDYLKQSVEQSLIIQYQKQPQTRTQKVTMQVRISRYLASLGYVTIFQELRSAISRYLGTMYNNAIEYVELPGAVIANIPLKVSWSNCLIPRSTCDVAKVTKFKDKLLRGSDIVPALKLSLMPNFEVLNLNFEMTGACMNQVSPPDVLNPLGILMISFCSQLKYQIPARTFYDRIDGNTRNLQLSLKNSNGTPLHKNSFVYFDEKEQTIYAALYDGFRKNISSLPHSFRFSLTATNKRGLSSQTRVELQINETHLNVTLHVSSSAIWNAGEPYSLARILTRFAEKADQYLPTKGIHFLQITRPTTLDYYYLIHFSSCTFSYTNCNTTLFTQVESMVANQLGPTDKFKAAMSPEFDIFLATVNRRGVCSVKDSSPMVLKPLPPINIYRCQTFVYQGISRVFRDEEDGVNLYLSVTKINEISVGLTDYSWILIRDDTRELTGVITDSVVRNQPKDGYNITVRATDSSGQFAETSFLVRILGGIPKNLYTFFMGVKLNAGDAVRIVDEYTITDILNQHFKSNITNLISLTRTGTQIMFSWSVCSLSLQCDEKRFASTREKLLINGTPNQEIINSFAPRYTLLSIRYEQSAACRGPLNPPVSKLNAVNISMSFCGGFFYSVPSNLFIDPEDGNTRNLKLKLVDNQSNKLVQATWIHLNLSSQVIYGYPTRDEAFAFLSSSISYKLVATDSSGLEGSVRLNFTLSVSLDAKYVYVFKYQPLLMLSPLEERRLLSRTISRYLKDNDESSFGLISVATQEGISKIVTYCNCSVRYKPCDLAVLRDIRSLLLQDNNLPTMGLVKSTSSLFDIKYGYTTAKADCSGKRPHPPYVSTPLPQLNMTICKYFSYRIPGNTFYDLEDGSTNELTLSLTGGTLHPWISFQEKTASIEAFATAKAVLSQPTSGYLLYITATDSSKLSASAAFRVQMSGPARLIRDCHIKTVYEISGSITTLSAVELGKRLIAKMNVYFDLPKTHSLGIFDLVYESSSRFSLYWGLCPHLIKTFVLSQSELHSYHKILIQNILMKLFRRDSKLVKQEFLRSFGSEISVKSVQSVFIGDCKNMPPINTNNVTFLSIKISVSGFQLIKIYDNWFYDYEQGGTTSLTMNITTEDKQILPNDYWISIDVSSKLIILIMTDKERSMATSVYNFYMMVTDFWGRRAYMKVIVEKIEPSISFKNFYNITYEVTFSSKSNLVPLPSQIVFVIQRIALFYNISVDSVMILRYFSGRGIPSYQVITWTVFKTQSCTSSTLAKTKGSFSVSNGLSNDFIGVFQPNINVKRIYYATSCFGPYTPPTITISLQEQNLSYCSPYSFQLPLSTFVDRSDGDIRRLKLQLLDKDQNIVTASSWLQLNTAFLRLYGLATGSVKSGKYTFYLSATNSGGISSNLKFTVVKQDYPHVSDCPITLSVTSSSKPTAETDVLWRLTSAISKYYGDTKSNIKILRFNKLSSVSYTLVYSNCSFQFNSRERALRGLNSSYQQSVSMIFSKVISPDKQVQSSFRSFLLPDFKVTAISVSYSCIEKAPISRYTQVTNYAYICQEYRSFISEDVFIDEKDGNTRNLKLSLHYLDGREISKDEWMQLDKQKQKIQGIVTDKIKRTFGKNVMYYILKATDSSGRAANVTYQIKLGDQLPQFKVKVILGFTSIFNIDVPISHILLNISRKIARYLDASDDKTRLHIYEFLAPSHLTFSYCPLNCTTKDLKNIVLRLQDKLFVTTPRTEFLQALKPEFNLYYVYVDGPDCIENINATIKTTVYPVINVSHCGVFDFALPINTFTINSIPQTKNLFLQLADSSGKRIDSHSWIYLNSALQTIYAVPVLNKISETVKYKILAKYPRSKEHYQSNVVINFKGLVHGETEVKNLCAINLTVLSAYSRNYADVFVLRSLMSKIAQYLDSSMSNLKLISYTREERNYLSILWTNCSWYGRKMTMQVYQAHILPTLTQLALKRQGSYVYRESLAKHLLPEYSIKYFSVSNSCDNPLPPSPEVNIKPSTIIAKCGELKYKIPETTFRYGDKNTRALDLQLLQLDGSQLPITSWVYFDAKVQTIRGLPSKAAKTNQPRGGYRYNLKALSPDGLFASTVITINITGTFGPPIIYLSILGMMTTTFTYDVEKLLYVTGKIASYELAKDSKNRLYIYDVYQLTPVTISVNIANCSTCDLSANLILIGIENNLQKFKNYLSPDITIFNAVNNYLPNTCDEEEVKEVAGNTLSAKFCQRWEQDITALLGAVVPSGYVVEVKQINDKQLSQDSWFWFNNTDNYLYGFPTKQVFESQSSTGSRFMFYARAWNTKKILGVRLIKSVHIKGPLPKPGLRFEVRFSTTLSTSNIDAYFIQLVWNKLVLSWKRSDLQTISFARTTLNNVVQFTYVVEICGISNDCSSTDFSKIEQVTFQEARAVKPEFQKLFLEELNLLSLKMNCQTKLISAVNITKNITVTVPACGFSRHHLLRNLEDKEVKGLLYNTSTRLALIDGTPLPVDSWIWLNDTSKELYALPPLYISQSYVPNGFHFLLLSNDPLKQNINISLYVFVRRGNDVHYKMSISFISRLPKTSPYLLIQFQLLSGISSFLGTNPVTDFQVINFELVSKTSNTFYIQWGVCSITSEICENQDKQLRANETRISTKEGQLAPALVSYLSRQFEIKTFFINRHYRINQPPKAILLSKIIPIKLCEQAEVPLSNVFSDTDNIDRLNVVLKYENNSVVPRNSWVQIYKTTAYIIPYKTLKPGEYKFLLFAKDTCDQEATVNVSVQVLDDQVKSGYQMKVVGRFNMTDTTPDSYYLVYVLKRFCQFLSFKKCHLRLLTYLRTEDKLQLTSDYCEVQRQPCDKEKVIEINRKLLGATNTTNDRFITFFSPNYNITQLHVTSANTCRQVNETITPKYPALLLNVSLCSDEILNYSVPDDTFRDFNGKNFSHILLASASGKPVSLSSWIQFNQTSRTIYGIPRISELQERTQRKYAYTLVAKNEINDQVSVPVIVDVRGNLPSKIVQFRLKVKTFQAKVVPDVATEISLLRKLSIYVANKFHLSDVSFSRSQSDGKEATFEVGICGEIHKICNCTLYSQIHRFMSDTRQMNTFLRPEFFVEMITVTSKGACDSQQTPITHIDWNEVHIDIGKPNNVQIPENKFYDQEDGWTRNLTLKLGTASDTNSMTNFIHDINKDTLNICTLFPWNRMTSFGRSSHKFVLRAADRCESTVSDSFIVHFSFKNSLIYFIQFQFLLPYNSLNGNCSNLDLLLAKLHDFAKLENTTIYVVDVNPSNSSSNASVVTIGFPPYNNTCDNTTAIYYRKLFINETGEILQNFSRSMLPEFPLLSATDNGTQGCLVAAVTKPNAPIKESFPWWIIITLLSVLLLIMLLWCCWICLPRFCFYSEKKTTNKCFSDWCTPGGRYASKKKRDSTIQPPRKDSKQYIVQPYPSPTLSLAERDTIGDGFDSDVDFKDTNYKDYWPESPDSGVISPPLSTGVPPLYSNMIQKSSRDYSIDTVKHYLENLTVDLDTNGESSTDIYHQRSKSNKITEDDDGNRDSSTDKYYQRSKSNKFTEDDDGNRDSSTDKYYQRSKSNKFTEDDDGNRDSSTDIYYQRSRSTKITEYDDARGTTTDKIHQQLIAVNSIEKTNNQTTKITFRETSNATINSNGALTLPSYPLKEIDATKAANDQEEYSVFDGESVTIIERHSMLPVPLGSPLLVSPKEVKIKSLQMPQPPRNDSGLEEDFLPRRRSKKGIKDKVESSTRLNQRQSRRLSIDDSVKNQRKKVKRSRRYRDDLRRSRSQDGPVVDTELMFKGSNQISKGIVNDLPGVSGFSQYFSTTVQSEEIKDSSFENENSGQNLYEESKLLLTESNRNQLSTGVQGGDPTVNDFPQYSVARFESNVIENFGFGNDNRFTSPVESIALTTYSGDDLQVGESRQRSVRGLSDERYSYYFSEPELNLALGMSKTEGRRTSRRKSTGTKEFISRKEVSRRTSQGQRSLGKVTNPKRRSQNIESTFGQRENEKYKNFGYQDDSYV